MIAADSKTGTSRLALIFLAFSTTLFTESNVVAALIIASSITLGFVLGSDLKQLTIISLAFPVDVDVGITVSFSPAIFMLLILALRAKFWRRSLLSSNFTLRLLQLCAVLSFTWVMASIGLITNYSETHLSSLFAMAKLIIASLAGAGVFLIVFTSSPRTRERLLKAWILGAMLSAGIVWAAVVLDQVGLSGLANRVIFIGWRAQWLFNDPNLYAFFLLIGLGFSLALWIVRQSISICIAIVIISGTLSFANSRAGLVALVACVVAGSLLLMGKSGGLIKWSVGAGVALSTYFGIGLALSFAKVGIPERNISPSAILNPLGSVGIDETSAGIDETSAGIDEDLQLSTVTRYSVSGDARFDFWREAIVVWESRPFFGTGFGKFSSASAEVESWIWGSGTPHNTFVLLLVEIGAVGLFALAMGVIVALASLAMQRDPLRLGLFGTSIGVITFLNAFDLPTSIMLWSFIGLVTGFSVPVPSGMQDRDHRVSGGRA